MNNLIDEQDAENLKNKLSAAIQIPKKYLFPTKNVPAISWDRYKKFYEEQELRLSEIKDWAKREIEIYANKRSVK